MKVHNIVSVSGGKDSTALALLASEVMPDHLRFVFADTGHEHQITYDYIDYLSGELHARTGHVVETVRADFTTAVERRRANLPTVWRAAGVDEEQIAEALEALKPTGNPFLDLCLLKARFPSTQARFCSQELKHNPIQAQIYEPLLESADCQAVISWQGVRADESPSRAKMAEHDVDFGSWDPMSGLLIYRPLIKWNVEQVFSMHFKHGVNVNPLYKKGMSRVGCMPCIHATKREIKAIAREFPEVFDKLVEWESIVGRASRRRRATFFSARRSPTLLTHDETSRETRSSAKEIQKWAQTTRGGRQFDLMTWMEMSEEPASCSSIYGLCE